MSILELKELFLVRRSVLELKGVIWSEKEVHDQYNSEISLCTFYLIIDLFKNNYLIILNFDITICYTINNNPLYRIVVCFLNWIFKISAYFFSSRWRLSAGCTGQAKAMGNKSELSQIKTNMNKATKYNVVVLSLENIYKPLENESKKVVDAFLVPSGGLEFNGGKSFLPWREEITTKCLIIA